MVFGNSSNLRVLGLDYSIANILTQKYSDTNSNTIGKYIKAEGSELVSVGTVISAAVSNSLIQVMTFSPSFSGTSLAS